MMDYNKILKENSILESSRLILRPFSIDDILNRIESTHYVGNEGSGRVMQKCGMNYEGTGLQEVKVNDVFYDVVHYAILREDWINAIKVQNL